MMKKKRSGIHQKSHFGSQVSAFSVIPAFCLVLDISNGHLTYADVLNVLFKVFVSKKKKMETVLMAVSSHSA